MSLRTFNAWMLAGLLAGCTILWMRELGLREQFMDESKRQVLLQSALAEAGRREEALRADLAELKAQLSLVRSQRDESAAARFRLEDEQRRRTEEWLAAIRRWEAAVGERDVRLNLLLKRETLLVAQLELASTRLREAIARLATSKAPVADAATETIPSPR